MNFKEERHQEIVEIIQNQKISRQEDLLDKLIIQGFTLTQATLSRDLKELKIGRVPDSKHGNVFFISTLDNNHNELHGISSIEYVGGMVLIKSIAGYANSIAATIDSTNIQTIAGTIAGNDTTLVILKSGVSFEEFRFSFLEKFKGIEYLF